MPLIVVVVVVGDIIKTVIERLIRGLLVTVDVDGERGGQIRLRFAHQVVQSVVPGANTNELVRVEVRRSRLSRARAGTSKDILVGVGATGVTDTSVTELGVVTVVAVPDKVTIVHQPLLGNLTTALVLTGESVGSTEEGHNQQNGSKHFHCYFEGRRREEKKKGGNKEKKGG